MIIFYLSRTIRHLLPAMTLIRLGGCPRLIWFFAGHKHHSDDFPFGTLYHYHACEIRVQLMNAIVPLEASFLIVLKMIAQMCYLSSAKTQSGWTFLKIHVIC